MQFVFPGQRWINHAQPELGLGTILEIDGRLVSLTFGASGRIINYALESAPLDRVRFSAGDGIEDKDGRFLEIVEVNETEGLIDYRCLDEHGAEVWLNEVNISPSQVFNRPLERLFLGQTDQTRWFQFRYDSQSNRNHLLQNHLWGLLGTRTSILPHQLYVAHEVAARHAPRVLLADEVGLGKTIEAGLIAHSQLITERISRVVIVLPESLVHQWLVEMLRRFNLRFSVFDQERCEAMDEGADDPSFNPFLDEQLIIVSQDFLLENPNRLEQCCKAGWDLLIVDEAHYLYWGKDGASAEYQQVELLSESSGGVLLLTGTPQQLGVEGHFARLRLLDPDRYFDPQQLQNESRDLAPLAGLVESIHQQLPLDESGQGLLHDMLGQEAADESDWSPQHRDDLVDRLLDRYGTGRVMFRNTRASVAGFPSRRVYPHPQTNPEIYQAFASAEPGQIPPSALLTPEILWPEDEGEWWQADPRVDWLIDRLQQQPEEKALVICAHKDTARDLTYALKHRVGITAAVFHEELTLVERDRAAAWFADAEEGCQVLVCSEIGSEGRNFQFANQLVLFDLPAVPDLLEQRIGRLDRIGQTRDVEIHVPYLENSIQAVMFRWYHEGLDAFESSSSVNHMTFVHFLDDIKAHLLNINLDMTRFLQQVQEFKKEMESEMRQGRDRLLEFHSCRPGMAQRLVHEAELGGDEDRLRLWLNQAFNCYGIHSESYRQRSLLIRPGTHMVAPVPGLPDEGLAGTVDRVIALENEDIHYLSWEHPLVLNLLDMAVNTERGNTCLGGLKGSGLARGTLLIEFVFMIGAPGMLHGELRRFVPPVIYRLVLDEKGDPLESGFDYERLNRNFSPLKQNMTKKLIDHKKEAIRTCSAAAMKLVDQEAMSLLQSRMSQGVQRLEHELSRLQHLMEINPNVRPEELAHVESLLEQARALPSRTRSWLDAMRVFIAL